MISESNIWDKHFALRRRFDGGYTIANGHFVLIDLIPDNFKFMRDFLPIFKVEQKLGMKLRLGKQFFQSWKMQKTGHLIVRARLENTGSSTLLLICQS